MVEAKKVTQLHANISPGVNHWISTSAGKRGLIYNYVVLNHEASVELYIDRGKQSDQENKAIFAKLEKSRSAIDAEFGGKLDWQPLPGKRACRIKAVVYKHGLLDHDKWPEIQSALIDAMVRLEKALHPHINTLT